MIEKTCENCRFAYWGVSKRQALCRRYPPQSVVLRDKHGDLSATERYPATHPGEWCGEFQSIRAAGGE